MQGKNFVVALLFLVMLLPLFGQKNGCLEGNCKNGFGIFRYPNGNSYEGQFENYMLNGTGTYNFVNGTWAGSKYTGEWKNNKMNGQIGRAHV